MDSGLRIHLTGASGTGTTTLGLLLAQELGIPAFDTDSFYWRPGPPAFEEKRPIPERRRLLEEALDPEPSWILSGSLAGWGDFLAPRFSHVIYLYLEPETRLKRLEAREVQRYGPEIEAGGSRRKAYLEFMDWAARYDHAGSETRSRIRHETWLAGLGCPVLRLEGPLDLPEKLKRIKAFL